MKKRLNDGVSIGRTFAGVARKTTTWYFMLAPITLLYLGFSIHFAWNYRPVSRLIGLPEKQAAALLIDLCFVMIPLLAALAKYLSWYRQKEKRARAEFVARFEGRELVESAINHNLVYHVLAREPDVGITRMQVVWTPDGKRSNGAIYEDVDEVSVRKFDPVRFLNMD